MSSGNYKWDKNEDKENPLFDPEKELRVVLFTSRNKDNSHLDDFQERRKAFLSTKSDEEIIEEFKDSFLRKSAPGELSRVYVSLNARDSKKIQKALIHFLLDAEDLNLASLPVKLAAISAQKENALEKKWFFDFDAPAEKLPEFLEDVEKEIAATKAKQRDPESFHSEILEARPTVSGHAVVVSRPFDSSKLLEKWHADVSLKRDDLLFLYHEVKA